MAEVAALLRQRTKRRYLMLEVYGPDGEILEASECWPLTAEQLASNPVQSVAVLYPDEQGRHAEPRRDWRERGVIPPRGFHRSQWQG
jgi:hypothetical protein